MNENKISNEIEVKRIYFKKESPCPFMELIDGKIKQPFFINTPTGIKLVWHTEEEAKNIIAMINKNKKDNNKPKIIELKKDIKIVK